MMLGTSEVSYLAVYLDPYGIYLPIRSDFLLYFLLLVVSVPFGALLYTIFDPTKISKRNATR